ncbi:hypothetical protein [Rhodopseudomonas sp. AAP120]|uniref:hypothetical protein n=1 Tax=Rhodopseudomonas sp. AAP120 TaxID=1523430 RepID=UPI0012E2DC79|nr:hypothetical protein [Rhodopseudomonas sp. AAP120]
MTKASLQMTSTESRQLARALGWFSLALGAAELIAPNRLTRALGMRGSEGLVQLYGLREIASGVSILSTESAASVWSRVAGDALDVGTLALHLRDDNRKKANVAVAIAAVGGIALLDLACAAGLSKNEAHDRADARALR